MLRGLRKCEACGFPISAGRVLCVECEEKKWRGQLRPQGSARKPPTGVAAVSTSKPGGGAFTAAAVSMAKAAIPTESGVETRPETAMPPVPGPIQALESEKTMPVPVAAVPIGSPETASRATDAPEFVLSAGIEPSGSWFSANKYIVVVLLGIGVAAAAFFFFR